MLIMFSPVIPILFRFMTVLFRVAAVVWKYFLSLSRSCNTKLMLSTIMTGEKGTNTAFLKGFIIYFFLVLLFYINGKPTVLIRCCSLVLMH